MFYNKKNIQLSLIMSGLFIPVTLVAQSSYMFPSDITDPSEQTKVDAQRAQRYESQRQWVYPDEKNVAPQRQYSQQQNSYENPDKGAEYPRSEHYKYDDFSRRNSAQPDYQDTRGRDDISSGRQAQRSGSHTDNGQSRYQPEQHYQSDDSYYQEPPREVYVSDLINKPQGQAKRFFPEKKDIGQFRARAKQPLKNTLNRIEQAADQAESQIRYIPVPVYTYALPPGTLPGTVPGIVTPPDMVPGYSHLSPSYGTYNSYGVSPYSVYPWSGTGGVPVVNPYQAMFPNYGGIYGPNNGGLLPYNPVNAFPGGYDVPGIFP